MKGMVSGEEKNERHVAHNTERTERETGGQNQQQSPKPIGRAASPWLHVAWWANDNKGHISSEAEVRQKLCLTVVNRNAIT